MNDHPLNPLCLYHLMDGLRDGLSHFSKVSRAAVIYAATPKTPLRIYDPQFLLQGHETKLNAFYLERCEWPAPVKQASVKGFQPVQAEKLDLAGLISFAAQSETLHYQRWFTEHHPDMCSTGPTERWLEHAAWLLSQTGCAETGLDVDTTGHVLREWATHAVRDYIVDARNSRIGWDTRLRVYPILDGLLGVSKTLEEGSRPEGELAFVEPGSLSQVNFLIEFPHLEQPTLDNHKHVRKLLLAVERRNRLLISDGRHILGVAAPPAPMHSIIGDFRGTYGFLRLDEELVCSFRDGKFQSSTRKAKLVRVEEALMDPRYDPLLGHMVFKAVQHIVHSAQEAHYGCTLVLDFNYSPTAIAGQKLVEPLDLRNPDLLDLAVSLAKMDGALHIGLDMRLHGFACLLDGRSVPSEDRARGARFNSALRFTAEREGVMVIVVSSDRPVSVIQDGVELTALCSWKAIAGTAETPPTLEEWVEEWSKRT